MFSYFEKGITDCKPYKKISIEALVKEIKTNNSTAIQELRKLDRKDKDYDAKKRKLKQTLPNITPNCTVSRRSLKNIIEFSGYVYFDIDDKENAGDYKAELIEKYKDSICLICLSSSGYGLSILTKIENEITACNFASIRRYICNHIFPDLKFDPVPNSQVNACYVSYDPDCYYNPSATIEIPQEFIADDDRQQAKSAFGTINYSSPDIVPNAPYLYKFIPIGEVINKLRFRTEVVVENRVFDMRPVEYCEVFLPPGYLIPKGKKIRVFSQVIHNLVFLNPDVSHDYIFSYIYWLNSHKTVPGTKASDRDLFRFFDMVCRSIKKSGVTNPTTRIKFFHCKPNTISPGETKILARKMTDMNKIYNSINKIQLAKQILESTNRESAFGTINYSSPDILSNALLVPRTTQQSVCDLLNENAKAKGLKGIGIRTVKKYWNVEPIDLDEVVQMENERIEITYVPKITQEQDICENDQEGSPGAHHQSRTGQERECQAEEHEDGDGDRNTEYTDDELWEHLKDDFGHLSGDARRNKITVLREIMEEQAAGAES